MLSDEQILEISNPFGCFQYGDSQGKKTLEFARAIEQAARAEALEEAAKLCEAKLLKLEESAQYARKNGDHDDASNIRSSAWHLNILADAIRALINKEQAQ